MTAREGGECARHEGQTGRYGLVHCASRGRDATPHGGPGPNHRVAVHVGPHGTHSELIDVVVLREPVVTVVKDDIREWKRGGLPPHDGITWAEPVDSRKLQRVDCGEDHDFCAPTATGLDRFAGRKVRRRGGIAV